MKPDFLEILKSDSSRLTADITTELIAGNPGFYDEVIDLSLVEKSPVNWRAARVAVLSAEEYPELFVPHVNCIAKKFKSFQCDGLKRSYASLLAKYTTYMNDDSKRILIDTCFKYMLEDEKPAVKYNCMKVLFELSMIIPEIKSELAAVIDFNISHGIFRMNGEIKKIYMAINLQIK
jgi:hypothetical protein